MPNVAGVTTLQAAKQYKAQVRDTWTMGNYEKLAERVYPIAEHLCDATGVGPNHHVLDIATGTGNVAIAAAKRGATVTAVDLTSRMVDLTRARAAEENVELRVFLGDAEDLPFQPDSFDIVLSACGMWWAPRPEVALAEARRVLRYNGIIGLAGFPSNSYFGQVEELIKARVPLPDGVPERNDWANEDIGTSRLMSAFDDVRCEVDTIPWVFESAAAATAFLFENSASHIAALRDLTPTAQAELIADVEELTANCSIRPDRIDFDMEYINIVGEVRI